MTPLLRIGGNFRDMPFEFFVSQCVNVIKYRLGDFPRGVEKAVRDPQT
jgi:hypothetical protein